MTPPTKARTSRSSGGSDASSRSPDGSRRILRWPQPGDEDDVVYVKAFATEPQQQLAIAHAANELVREQQARMRAWGEVLTSDDGLRVWLVWRWRGSRRELIERDADVVREALGAHAIFAHARAVEARILRGVPAR